MTSVPLRHIGSVVVTSGLCIALLAACALEGHDTRLAGAVQVATAAASEQTTLAAAAGMRRADETVMARVNAAIAAHNEHVARVVAWMAAVRDSCAPLREASLEEVVELRDHAESMASELRLLEESDADSPEAVMGWYGATRRLALLGHEVLAERAERFHRSQSPRYAALIESYNDWTAACEQLAAAAATDPLAVWWRGRVASNTSEDSGALVAEK